MTAPAIAEREETLEPELEETDLWLLIHGCALDGLRLRIGIEMTGIDKRDDKDNREQRLARLQRAVDLHRRWNVLAGEIPRRPPPAPTTCRCNDADYFIGACPDHDPF